MTTVIPVTNPGAFEIPEVVAFLREAFARNTPAPAEVIIDELPRYLHLNEVGVFFGREGGAFKGLIIVMLPTTPLTGPPEVWFMYNAGSPALREALVSAACGFIATAGYKSFRTLNVNGRDGAFERLFKSAGNARRLGTVFEFTLARD